MQHMNDCKCRNVTLYDKEWKCILCAREFFPHPKEARITDYFVDDAGEQLPVEDPQ